jgi:hypothetical protein
MKFTLWIAFTFLNIKICVFLNIGTTIIQRLSQIYLIRNLLTN